ncbi:hypothetical protein F7734_46760 [Scytonema sp. UIC 10036]|uniref:hypothetical protein n=1 Tax=Scytonema sp. UIC 10036 TaxID=2304196 RepID=UPI0012DABDD4|nr:hypothetical protein [Scytonema sp. UIC 10036]MUG99397.1 hypothetical protein [Scytonema sp. UIC 10036]
MFHAYRETPSVSRYKCCNIIYGVCDRQMVSNLDSALYIFAPSKQTLYQILFQWKQSQRDIRVWN